MDSMINAWRPFSWISTGSQVFVDEFFTEIDGFYTEIDGFYTEIDGLLSIPVGLPMIRGEPPQRSVL